MANPTMSLLQAKMPAVDLSKAASMLQTKPATNPLGDSFREKQRREQLVKEQQFKQMRDQLLIKNTLENKYSPVDNAITQGYNQVNNTSLLDYIAGFETPGSVDPYSAVNKNTGAFGRYQFIPKYAKPYADKLGVTVDDMRANPNLQDTAAKLKLQDLQRELASYGIPVTKQNIYLGWQEGAKGLYDLMQGKLPGGSYKALDLNLPKGIDRTPKAFLNYWYNRL